MTEERSITVRIEGGRQASAWLDRNTHFRSQSLKRFIDKLANHALYWIRIYAPIGETLYLQHHIDRGVVTWHPGGYGGGGTWEVELGVKHGTSLHPLYVHNGTGIYVGHDPITPSGDRAPASIIGGQDRPLDQGGYFFRDSESSTPRLQGPASMIRSRAGLRPVMTFQKKGEPRRFRAVIAGQHPQPFVYLAYLKAQLYTHAHIHGDILRGGI